MDVFIGANCFKVIGRRVFLALALPTKTLTICRVVPKEESRKREQNAKYVEMRLAWIMFRNRRYGGVASVLTLSPPGLLGDTFGLMVRGAWE
jgi:hypothetical protein